MIEWKSLPVNLPKDGGKRGNCAIRKLVGSRARKGARRRRRRRQVRQGRDKEYEVR